MKCIQCKLMYLHWCHNRLCNVAVNPMVSGLWPYYDTLHPHFVSSLYALTCHCCHKSEKLPKLHDYWSNVSGNQCNGKNILQFVASALHVVHMLLCIYHGRLLLNDVTEKIEMFCKLLYVEKIEMYCKLLYIEFLETFLKVDISQWSLKQMDVSFSETKSVL